MSASFTIISYNKDKLRMNGSIEDLENGYNIWVDIHGMNGLDLNNIAVMPVGVLVVIAAMAVIAIGLIFFFIKKKWLLARETKITKQKFTEKQVNRHENKLERKQS